MSDSLTYMHPAARAAFDAACKAANLRPVVVQTEGAATQSAGTHAADGKYQLSGGEWHEYTAAVDLSVNQHAHRLSDGADIAMDRPHIHWMLQNLAEAGFVAWYRTPAEGFDASHIHAVFAGVKMKAILQGQVRDFLNDRTGLKGHATETFYTAPPATDAKIRAMFLAANG